MKTKLAVLLLTGLLVATGFVRAQDDTNQIARKLPSSPSS